MGIFRIHGFLHDKQKNKPEWGNITVSETVLVEMDSPEDTQMDLLNALPASPNTVTSWNPKGISFTFDLSQHPDSSAFLLRSAGEIQQVDGSGVFWEVPLNYAVFSYWELTGPAIVGSNSNPRQRKDQRDVKVPTDRPVVWNSTTSIVSKETYQKADGTGPIVHTNGLPITSPFKWDETHTTHSFSYNIAYSSFNYADTEPFKGRVDSFGIFSSASYEYKLVSISANEEYESIGEGVAKTEYHYVRVTLVFELNPSGWLNDAKLVSMSTVQLTQMIVSPFSVYYDKIRSSATEYAQEPWPLDANGLAIPYDDNNPANYGYVNHGYPKIQNLSALVAGSGAGCFNKALVIP